MYRLSGMQRPIITICLIMIDSQDENYIIYEDANSLYAWAMTEALPYKDLRFDTTSSLRAILDTPDDVQLVI